MTQKKTDNANMAAKLALRRYMLQRYHADEGIRVMDCCQGSGAIWSALRKEFSVESYWGVDKKKKKGRMQLDSARILEQPGWPQNVIDIDTYGSPWRHYAAMMPNVRGSITVFLTIGQLVTVTVGSLSRASLEAMGLGQLTLPKGLHPKLSSISVSYCLASCYDHGIIMHEAVEVESDARNVRYVGVRLAPSSKRAHAGRSREGSPTQAGKEPEHGR